MFHVYSTGCSKENEHLCELFEEEKLRICVAIFNSGYFAEKINFSPSDVIAVDGSCEKNDISFRTENGMEKAAGRHFEESMMSCNPKKKDQNEDKLDYLLSGAYENNKIFVFFKHNETQKIYLENLSTNVRYKAGNLVCKSDEVNDEGENPT